MRRHAVTSASRTALKKRISRSSEMSALEFLTSLSRAVIATQKLTSLFHTRLLKLVQLDLITQLQILQDLPDLGKGCLARLHIQGELQIDVDRELP